MKIALGSTSPIKLAALTTVAKGFNQQAEIVAVPARSGVNEQPAGYDETYKGALNRAQAAFEAVPDADFAIGIESGLFPHGVSFADCAVAVALVPGKRALKAYAARSAPLGFPAECVRAARKAGFATTTVGQVMAAAGLIKQADDPHQTLAGISRETFLVGALTILFGALQNDKVVTRTPEMNKAMLLGGSPA